MITPIYAAFFVIFFVLLSVRTLTLRRRHAVAVGYGEHPQLVRAIRAHSNFAEYVPIALLALFFVEASGAASAIVHGAGGVLLIGRIIHAYGLSQTKEDLRLRVAGMAMTFTVLISTSLYLLIVYM